LVCVRESMDKQRDVGTDYSFVQRELENAGYRSEDGITAAVEALFATLDGAELDLLKRRAAAQLFTSLVEKDGSLGTKAGPRSQWKQFYLGTFPYGSTVRVRTDAYETPSGARHNGLTGIFVSAHAGRAFVQYHGRKDGSGHEHHPSKLEVLWRSEDS
jgi:hypothetical protein